jgi:hypothetical protein
MGVIRGNMRWVIEECKGTLLEKARQKRGCD